MNLERSCCLPVKWGSPPVCHLDFFLLELSFTTHCFSSCNRRDFLEKLKLAARWMPCVHRLPCCVLLVGQESLK